MSQYEVTWRDGEKARKVVTPAESSEEAEARAVLLSEGYASQIEVKEITRGRDGH